LKQELNFDPRDVHRHFSAACFNNAWTFIEKPTRTPEENERMILMSLASLWHWTQREDCSPRNLAIGYWQASRVYALAGLAGEARRYGELCLRYSRPEPPFYLAYAYEALARAEKVAGNPELATQYRDEAARLAEQVQEEDDKKLIVDDLKTI
jgi:hypothetical protein